MRSMVWLSFEFTYLSNIIVIRISDSRFDYPLNLHISQTPPPLPPLPFLFDYPLNLHISQTRHKERYIRGYVWLSFEFTYLSNAIAIGKKRHTVWLSFEFTYLSNFIFQGFEHRWVWLSFEFTYLSNKCSKIGRRWRFDYPLNLHISQTRPAPRGRD